MNYHTDYLLVIFCVKCIFYIRCKLLTRMIVMECFDALYLHTLFITISRERIHESIDFTNLWDIVRTKITLIRRRSDKYSTIFEEKTPHTMFTHSTVTNIAISDIHRILRKNTIANRKGYLLIPDKKPGMFPKIVIIDSKTDSNKKKRSYCPSPRIITKKIHNKCDRKCNYEDIFQCSKKRNNPMLVCFIEDFFVEFWCWFVCHNKISIN